MIDAQQALETAMEAAKLAGDLLMERYDDMHVRKKSMTVREKTSALDLVTEADAESQRLLIDILHSRFPDHRFIAEEEGADGIGNSSSPYTWIVDPLDGTTCFVHGRENFGVIIALQYNGNVELGVIYLPLKQQLFHGRRGDGVRCNGKPLALRSTRDMRDAVLCSNIVRRAKACAGGALHVSTPLCASLENYGSAAEEFSEVLLGHNDGCFFDGIRLWDVAAGCMMIEEMGGKSRCAFQEPGNVRGGLLVVASTAPIFDALCAFVFTKRLM